MSKENTVSSNFLSALVDCMSIFNCRLSSVLLYTVLLKCHKIVGGKLALDVNHFHCLVD